MATPTTPTETAPSSTLESYQEKIRAQMAEAKARLEQLQANAKEKGAQAETATIAKLQAAKQIIDGRVQDLKRTNASDTARAKAEIDADVAALKASLDEFTARFKSPSAK